MSFYHPEKGKNEWILIQAGAGAGKTSELVSRVLSFAIEFRKRERRFPKILVTTFTIKATQELKERLLKATLKMSSEMSPQVSADLQSWLLSPSVNITTIHGSVLRFLREKGSEIGLTSDFQVIESSKQLVSEFLKIKFFYDESLREYLLPLYREFSFSDLVDIISSGLNFKLANKRLLPYESSVDKLRWISRLNSNIDFLKINLKTVNQNHLKSVAQNRAYETYQALLGSCFKSPQEIRLFFENNRLTGSNKFGREEWDVLMIEALKQIKGLGEEDWNFDFLSESEIYSKSLVSLIDLIFNDWIKFVFQKQKIPLSDIEAWGLYLANQFPNLPNEFSGQWDYWYVDEYQDTSPMQMKLIRALMGERKGFFVGDPQQSIYLFRGSRPNVFRDKLNEIRQVKGEVQLLKKNYRTHKAPLEFINQFINQIKSQDFLMMDIGKIHPDPGFIRIKRFYYEKKFDPSNWIGGVCLEHIEQLKKRKDGLNYSHIAILAPQSKELSWICKALEKARIPYQLHSGGTYYQRREVLDAIQVLRFLIMPNDDANIFGIINSEYSEVSTEVLFRLKKTKNQSYWSQLQNLLPDSFVVKKLYYLLNLAKNSGFFWAWVTALDEINLFPFYITHDASGISEANIWKLVSETYENQAKSGFDWHQYYWDLMDKVEMNSTEKDSVSDAESNRVQLMTIHASKGLEFKHIILPYFERKKNNSRENRFIFDESSCQILLRNRLALPPQAHSIQAEFDNLELEEKDRVWYVGMTRAIESIYVPYAQKSNEKQISTTVSILNKFDSEDPEKIDLPEIEKDFREEFKKVKVTYHKKAGIDLIESPASFTSLDLFQRQVQGMALHEHLEKSVLSRAKLDNDPYLSWVPQFFMKWAERIPTGYPEWGYTLKKDNLTSQRIDLWGYDLANKVVWILDYKSGRSVNIDEAWKQLESYAHDLRMLDRIPNGFQIELAIVLLDSKNILECEFR